MTPSRMVRLMVLAAQCALLGGCVTGALWSEGAFTRYYEPACPPNLALYQSPQTGDVLARYDESYEGNDRITRRAYWVGVNQGRIAAGERPHFVASPATDGLLAVPVSTAQTNSADVPPGGRCVAVVTNQIGFALCSPGQEPRLCQLPVYASSNRRVLQVALTPLAVAADLSVVGCAIGYLWVESQAESGHWYGPYSQEHHRR